MSAATTSITDLDRCGAIEIADRIAQARDTRNAATRGIFGRNGPFTNDEYAEAAARYTAVADAADAAFAGHISFDLDSLSTSTYRRYNVSWDRVRIGWIVKIGGAWSGWSCVWGEPGRGAVDSRGESTRIGAAVEMALEIAIRGLRGLSR